MERQQVNRLFEFSEPCSSEEGGKMRKILILVSCLLFVSCAVSKKEVKKETEKEKVVEKKAAGTIAIRILPEFYTPGKTITVKIEVSPVKKTSGVIVEENIPENWEIIKSTPAYMKKNSNAYKWLIYGKEVAPFEIVYTVKIPEKEKGEKKFHGVVKTFKEGIIPIGGDEKISNR